MVCWVLRNEWEEMGWMKMGEEMDLWLARIQFDMAQAEFRWRSDMLWFQLISRL